MRHVGVLLWLELIVWAGGCGHAHADQPGNASKLLSRSNLVAWCIVPFDAAKRNPAQRAEMITRLGLRRVAYDWRREHVATFEEEIEQYKRRGIEFFAFWSWHDSIGPLIRKHQIRPQIWVTLGSPEANTQSEKVSAAARSMLPMLSRTHELGLKLGLYNHGGWGGRPENLAAVCKYLREHHQGDHVGIVYNFHHGHDHVADFSRGFAIMKEYLLCVNLNGMADRSSVDGNVNKILPIGRGKHEREMIEEIIRQGYSGPIGVLDHRHDLDAEVALRQNLAGLERLVREID